MKRLTTIISTPFKTYYSFSVVSNYTLQYNCITTKYTKQKRPLYSFIIISSSSFKRSYSTTPSNSLSFPFTMSTSSKVSMLTLTFHSLFLLHYTCYHPYHSFKSANLMRLSMVSLITTFSFRGLFHYRKRETFTFSIISCTRCKQS